MKRLTLVAALATLAILGGLSSPATAAEPASAATASVAATEPATDGSFAEPETSFFESTEATCEDFGFFAADKKGECDKSCKKGNKCQRKQVCGDGQCPPPGYCWKCPN